MSERPLQLMLVDEDPTFRLGLRVWLEQLPGFEIAAEASSSEETLDVLKTRAQSLQQAFDDPAHRSEQLRPIDLIILDIGLGEGRPDKMPGLKLCQSIKTEFAQLPVLVLSAKPEPVLEAAARQVGADGYGTRGMPVRELARLIRQVAQAESDSSEQLQRSDSTASPATSTAAPTAAGAAGIPGPFTAMRLSMRLSGLQTINTALDKLSVEQQQPLSWLERSVLEGRTRELKTARWLVRRLWATPRYQGAAAVEWGREQGQSLAPVAKVVPRSWLAVDQRGEGRIPNGPPRSPFGAGGPGPSSGAVLSRPVNTNLRSRTGDLQTLVFEAVFSKLQTNLDNVSSIPLEIDILRVDKKRELFYLILRQLEDLLDDLRQSTLQPGQLPQKVPQVLQDLWDAVIEEFFGKYYTVRVNTVEQEVVSLLQQEKSTVQQDLLNRIPLVSELLAHWLFQESLLIDGSPYLATTSEAIRHSEKLLENLLIQVANAVMQPLLNRLADVEAIKKSLYSLRLMSTREIERFRNELAWRYRWDGYVNEPKSIFESQYRLFTLTPQGIDATVIYAPRRDELDQLSGLQWAMTMVLETRDALSPRVRAVFSLVGSGFVYVLTEVVGRGIGLVGRGIFKGVGNAWQDTRRSRHREPPGFNEWE